MFTHRVVVSVVFLLGITLGLRSAPLTVRAVRTGVPPKIDGVLDDEAWLKAPEFSGFILSGTTRPATQTTSARVLYDRDAIYVGVTCMEDRIGQTVGESNRRDADLNGEDHIEIFLGPSHDRFNFLQFSLSINGNRFDASGDGAGISADWDAPWEGRTQRSSDRWTAEVAIPFSCLGLGTGTGSTWDFNVARVERPHGERSSWSPAGDRFHAPATFGVLEGLDVDFSPYAVSFGLSGPLVPGFGRNVAEVRLANPLDRTRRLRCDLTIHSPSEKPRRVEGTAGDLEPGSSAVRALGFQIFEPGVHCLVFSCADLETGRDVAAFEENFDLRTPVEHSLFHSFYRDDVSIRSRLNVDSAALGNYRLTADLFSADGETPVASVVSLPTGRELVTSLAPRSFPAGRYRVVMRLEHEGVCIHEQSLAFAHARDCPAATLRVHPRDDLTLIVDGAPFFPIGIYAPPVSQKVIDEYRAAGVNTVKTHGGSPVAVKMILDRYWANGFRTCVVLGSQMDFSAHPENAAKSLDALVAAIGRHDGLLMYESIDEPAWGGRNADGLLLGYEHLRELDPHHPVWTNHAPRNPISTLAYFNRATDLAGCDIYPVPEPANQSNLPNRTLSVVGDETDKNRAAVLDQKPILMVLQGFAWRTLQDRADPAAVYPTLEQQRFMAYDAVLHGARGILYWGVQYMPKPSRAWCELKQMINELSRLHPMLVAPVLPAPEITSSTGRVEIMRRDTGGHIYLIILNPENRPATVTVGSLPGSLTSLRVLYENNRRLDVHEGAFRLELSPYGVAVATDDDSFADTRPDYSAELLNVSGTISLPASREPGNLIANPSFELDPDGSGLPGFWTCRYPFTALLTPEEPRTGSRCLEFTSPADDFMPLLIQNSVPVEDNQEYELSAWFRTDGGDIMVRVYAEWVIGGVFHNAVVPWTAGTGKWQRLAKRFTSTPAPGGRLYVVVQSKGSGRAWIDDVMLSPAGENHP